MEYHRPVTCSLEKEIFDLPSHDVISKILSEYLHINKQPTSQTRPEPEQQKINPELNQTFDPHSPHNSPPVPVIKDDPQTDEVTEHQTKMTQGRHTHTGPDWNRLIGLSFKPFHFCMADAHSQFSQTPFLCTELENYRTAMHRMADDIIILRSQVSSLESENSQLRRDLSLHQDLGHTMLDDIDVDVMTRAEIADRIASLKLKLTSESSRATSQNDRIQQLQNELIKKNDAEKEFIQLQRVHQQQQALLKKYQARSSKITALQETVHQQDKVIEKMETILDAKLRERNQENPEKKKRKDEEHKMREIETVLATENSRLREELNRLRTQPLPFIIQQPVQSFSDSEKLELLTQVARAEGRIQSLEQQLKENSRQWGKEKQDMLTRLSEYEHGFARTPTMVLHDLPVKSVTDSVLGRVRHGQLDPLK